MLFDLQLSELQQNTADLAMHIMQLLRRSGCQLRNRGGKNRQQQRHGKQQKNRQKLHWMGPFRLGWAACQIPEKSTPGTGERD